MYSCRRAWPPGDTHRPIKRLFTPEIKRMLKDWLVRRRDNPYPSRDEKKALAIDCGLTYTQICNWFANWRRKLKNSGREPQKKTWGNLIKNYNTNAKGNVEQFSICSGDSIWGDDGEISQLSTGSSTSSIDANYQHHPNEPRPPYQYQFHFNDNNNNLNKDNNDILTQQYCDYIQKTSNNGYIQMQFNGNIRPMYSYTENNEIKSSSGHCILTGKNSPSGNWGQAQCFQISSTTDESKTDEVQNEYNKSTTIGFSNTKYKNHIMEKYLRGLNESNKIVEIKKPQLSKWLESAAKFTPEKNSYIDWNLTKK